MREQRTLTQNRALHKYCELLAEALNDAGYEMKAVLAVKVVDVPWSKELVKEALWKPIQAAMDKGESYRRRWIKGSLLPIWIPKILRRSMKF